MKYRIGKKLYRKKYIDDIQKQINLLGKDIKFDAIEFINMRLLTTLLLIIILFFMTSISYIIIPFIAILYYYLYYYMLITRPIKLRIQKLDREALAFFEILTLTLESGRNLDNSLEITCMNVDSELSDEFKQCLVEVKFGKTLIEALNDMKKRIPSETVNNIILNIAQTNVFGNSIIDTMNNQVEFLRDKQVLEIKSQINKIPNKVSIISVLFVVPLILLIILGPFIVEFLG